MGNTRCLWETLQPLMVYQHSMSIGLISGKSERNPWVLTRCAKPKSVVPIVPSILGQNMLVSTPNGDGTKTNLDLELILSISVVRLSYGFGCGYLLPAGILTRFYPMAFRPNSETEGLGPETCGHSTSWMGCWSLGWTWLAAWGIHKLSHRLKSFWAIAIFISKARHTILYVAWRWDTNRCKQVWTYECGPDIVYYMYV